MPRCYFLAVCAGSSLDQQTNNVSLFTLVEQVNVPPGAPPPPRNLLPLEVHCYFRLDAPELGRDLEMRFVLVGGSGLESFSDVHLHRAPTPRYRTRTLGIPYPPGPGHFELRAEFRLADAEWQRDPLAWPLAILEARPASSITH